MHDILHDGWEILGYQSFMVVSFFIHTFWKILSQDCSDLASLLVLAIKADKTEGRVSFMYKRSSFSSHSFATLYKNPLICALYKGST